MARTPRLGGVVGVAHLGVVGHLGGGRVHRLGGVLGQLVGRGLGLLEALALQVVGVRRLAVLALVVLAAFLVLAVLAVLLVVLAAALVAHVERVEQVVDGVAEAALVLDQLLQPVERAAGAVLDQRPPQVDQLACAAGGGASPVRRSRTIMATASSIGASARSVISSNLPR